MEAHALVVISAFGFLAISMFILGAFIGRTGINFLGKPTLDKYFFYSGKLSLLGSLVFFLSRAIFPGLGLFTVPVFLSWTAAILLCIAAVLFTIGFANLGTSLRVGLPGQETVLKTQGIYRLTRNPLYVTIYMMCFASLMYFPNQVNLVLVMYGIFVHHRIILGEEKFLADRFGPQWEEYKRRVRRYL
jgi:protein-S-isoprenylcysteine O-methyltransferase Ste14